LREFCVSLSVSRLADPPLAPLDSKAPSAEACSHGSRADVNDACAETREGAAFSPQAEMRSALAGAGGLIDRAASPTRRVPQAERRAACRWGNEERRAPGGTRIAERLARHRASAEVDGATAARRHHRLRVRTGRRGRDRPSQSKSGLATGLLLRPHTVGATLLLVVERSSLFG
jgi:hypothetical protein